MLLILILPDNTVCLFKTAVKILIYILCACSILEPVKMTYRTIRDFIGSLLSFFTWSNIKNTYHTFRNMTYGELSMAFLKGNVHLFLMVLTLIFHIFWWVLYFLILMSHLLIVIFQCNTYSLSAIASDLLPNEKSRI